jgi:hypothetical protein
MTEMNFSLEDHLITLVRQKASFERNKKRAKCTIKNIARSV